jgi:hypothetical protein
MVDSDWFEEAVENALASTSPEISKDVDVTQVVYEYIDRLHAEYAEKYFDVIEEE